MSKKSEEKFTDMDCRRYDVLKTTKEYKAESDDQDFLSRLINESGSSNPESYLVINKLLGAGVIVKKEDLASLVLGSIKCQQSTTLDYLLTNYPNAKIHAQFAAGTLYISAYKDFPEEEGDRGVQRARQIRMDKFHVDWTGKGYSVGELCGGRMAVAGRLRQWLLDPEASKLLTTNFIPSLKNLYLKHELIKPLPLSENKQSLVVSSGKVSAVSKSKSPSFSPLNSLS